MNGAGHLAERAILRRVVVVNDVATVGEMLSAQLRALGLEVVGVAGDGSAALNLLVRHQPDVVVCDIHMPVLDGFQLCRAMRSHAFPSLNQVPVILVSATYREPVALDLLATVGAQGFLRWPLSGRELETLLRQIEAEPGLVPENRPRVLVADDDPGARATLRRALAAAGFEVRTAVSGREAVARGTDWEPQLVLCDYLMPDGDGVLVLDWYCENRPEVPVVMMTAAGSDELAVELMRRGACDYLAKPTQLGTVVVACRAALERFQLKRVAQQFEARVAQAQRGAERQRALLEEAADPILVLDREGVVVEANREARELLGRGLFGARLADLLQAPGAALLDRSLRSLSEHGGCDSVTLTFSGGDGEPRRLACRFSWVENEALAVITARVLREEAAPERPAADEPTGRGEEGPAGSGNVLAVPGAAPPVVLVVEDDPMVQRLTQRILREAGCDVLLAADGERAIELWRGWRGAIDLALIDVVLPGMRGTRVASLLSSELPQTGVMLMSGYRPDSLEALGASPAGFPFLQKPFTRETLRQAVTALLDARRQEEPGG